jgi:hypothetical protein
MLAVLLTFALVVTVVPDPMVAALVVFTGVVAILLIRGRRPASPENAERLAGLQRPEGRLLAVAFLVFIVAVMLLALVLGVLSASPPTA